MSYTFNRNKFDVIDTEEKAYWLGFLWCDAYVGYRLRGERGEEYSFKLDLATYDSSHLEKLKQFLESTHPIKTYRSNSFNGDDSYVSRFYICNKHFGKTLYNEYGLRANRSEFSKYKHKIPKHLFKHFIRGCLDADGSLVISNVELYKHTPSKNRTLETIKLAVNFSTYEEIVNEINMFLHDEGITKSIVKTSKRHEDRDGYCVCLKYCGNNQCKQIVEYLYEDATIYLDRKYNKYKEFMEV